MFSDFEESQDLNKLVFYMASLSPKAALSLDTEGYRLSADNDTVTDQYVLEDIFLNFIKDIEELGIVLSFDYSDLVHNLKELNNFIHLMMYFLPNSLYDILKKRPVVKKCVFDIIEGSLGDNETILKIYLNELGGLEGQDPLLLELVDTIDHYYLLLDQTPIFSDYFKNIKMLLSEEQLVENSKVEDHIAYYNKLKIIFDRFDKALELFEQDNDYQDLLKYKTLIVNHHLASDNIANYHYLFLTDKSTLPDEIKPLYEQRWYHYLVSHKWCKDYYILRNLNISLTWLKIVYSFTYAFYENIDDLNHQLSIIDQHLAGQEIKERFLPLLS